MAESVLKVLERADSERPNLLRKAGFIPAVLNGEGYERGIPVKVEELNLNRIVHAHGANAKVWIDYNGNRLFGFLKELQRNCLNERITHSDIHILSQNDDIRVKLPIIFDGASDLEHKNLALQIHSHLIDITGKAGLLPEHVTVKVDGLELGDTVKVNDFKLNDAFKVHDPANTVYAVVARKREEIVEAVAEKPADKPAEKPEEK